jgi:general nucleoside transport system permease protein
VSTAAPPTNQWTARAEKLTDARTVAILGIAFGVLAFWLALPPWTTRGVGWPIAAGFISLACGIAAVPRGERKLGYYAIGLGILGTIGAIWLQGKEAETLNSVLTAGLLASTLRFATPLAFAAIGGIFSERSGVVNIGLEGMMLTGAFFGIWGSVWSGSWVIGLLMAMLFGGLLGLIHAVFSIHLRADQIVSGFAVNFLALGLTGYLFSSIYPGGIHEDVSRVPQVNLEFLGGIPVVGDFMERVFGHLNLLVWIMFAVVILSYIVLFKTPIGLRIRSVGEHPKAADTVGISVYGVRYAAVVTSGVLAALGGAFLSIGFVGSFAENMTSGRGFIALAAVIFGKWRPGWAFAACLLFGFGFALAIPMQREAGISENLISTLPYVLTLVALVGLIGRSIPPAAVGRPYVKQ